VITQKPEKSTDTNITTQTHLRNYTMSRTGIQRFPWITFSTK